MRVIVTGGAGFIGSAVVRFLVSQGAHVLNIDKLTYAADLRSVADCEGSRSYDFIRADICDGPAIADAIRAFRPTGLIHLAAESHVDRSIDTPADFLRTNILGTYTLLEAVRAYLAAESSYRDDSFRFVLVSTDEVYGSLGTTGHFTEATAYAPNSPYSASKAAADHLGRAWYKTYGTPVIVTNCSNNYGPFQHTEKLIPTVIRNALNLRPIPIYGTGANVRDWLFVDDHVRGLVAALERGRLGEKYNFGGEAEISNLDLAQTLCALLDERQPRPDGKLYGDLISFVPDRPGHDFRYAINSDKSVRDLGWKRQETSASGLAITVDWYLANRDWLEAKPDDGRLGLAQQKGR
jgi:dTDP-glucose 4,6-dehydratase